MAEAERIDTASRTGLSRVMISDEQLRALDADEREQLARRLAAVAGPAASVQLDRYRRLAWTALIAAVALVPWTFGLARTLPAQQVVAHWNATWVGFDVLLLASLACAGYAAWRRHRLVLPLAVIAATLLACDAWFDVSTALAGGELVWSLATALLVELPLGAALVRGAARSVRGWQ